VVGETRIEELIGLGKALFPRKQRWWALPLKNEKLGGTKEDEKRAGLTWKVDHLKKKKSKPCVSLGMWGSHPRSGLGQQKKKGQKITGRSGPPNDFRKKKKPKEDNRGADQRGSAEVHIVRPK